MVTRPRGLGWFVLQSPAMAGVYTRTLPLILAAVLAGCSNSTWFGLVYQVDVQQGNVIDQELMNKLERGMSKSAVRDALGTPLLVDPFHPQQWLYVHTFLQEEGYTQRNLVLHFEGDVLARVDGNVRARIGPLIPTDDNSPRAVRVPDPPPKGLLARLLSGFRDAPTNVQRPGDEAPGRGLETLETGESIIIEGEQEP